MRYSGFYLTLIFSVSLVVILNLRLGKIPPLGKFFDPFQGFWHNSEKRDRQLRPSLEIEGLKEDAEVWYDTRQVAHIKAKNDHDVYFLQGYVTARDRLWQMDLQVRAALGTLAEVFGPAAIPIDRKNRRKGLGFGAENSLAKVMENEKGKEVIEAFTNGVNAWISNLHYRDYPIEFKLMGYEPSPWTPLKTAGLLKYMADMLTGQTEDWEYSNAWTTWGAEKMAKYFPVFGDSIHPIIPVGTDFSFEGSQAHAPENWNPQSIITQISNPRFKANEGSNNWAVSGSKTKSGFPILCNDPHLRLSLPSIWYEIQMTAPGLNVYGATLPGAPGVVIGFNDQVAWGVTNAGRDVLDWYTIEYKDESRKEYKYADGWEETKFRVERIPVKGQEDFLDTVAYTIHGPVSYDRTFVDGTRPVNLAMRWMAHDSSNEMMTFYYLNRAKNHSDYREALKYFSCPGQNFIFASGEGDVAITQNGKFPDKWTNQGRYIMDGSDPAQRWQAYIPFENNPHVLNPPRGFVSSANQVPTDSTYPYHVYGKFEHYRNRRINQVLAESNGITVADMSRLQGDNLNVFATEILPVFLNHLQMDVLNAEEKRMAELLREWNYMNDPDLKAPSLFTEWADRMDLALWYDEIGLASHPLPEPDHHVTAMLLQKDPNADFVDDARTPVVETLTSLSTSTFREACASLKAFSDTTKKDWTWATYKGTMVQHMSRQIAAFSREGIQIGGDLNIVNACNKTHGPSWRMVVEFTPKPVGHGIFPGGQSGNPGSPWYDNMISDWAADKLQTLEFIYEGQAFPETGIHQKIHPAK